MARSAAAVWTIASALLAAACGGPAAAPSEPSPARSLAVAPSPDGSGGGPAGEPAARRRLDVAVAPEVPAELELEPGTCHSIELPLERGTGLTLTVDQHGVDLVERLFDPEGIEVAVFDAPVRDHGLDAGAWIAERTGRHRLEICAWERSAGGSYRIELHHPVATDRRLGQRVEAFGLFARGEAELARGHDAEAREAYLRADALWRTADDPRGRAWAAYQLGYLAWRQGDLDRAAEAFGRAADLYESCGARRAVARAAAFEGNALRDAGRHRRALAAYRRARSEAQAVSDAALERRALEGVASSQARLDEPLEALASYQALLDAPRFRGDLSETARVLRRQGLLYQDLGEAGRARDLFRRGLRLAAEDAGGEDALGAERAKLLLSLGGAELDLGRLPAAESALARARDLFERSGDRTFLAWTLSRLGRLDRESGRPDAARFAYERAFAVAEGLGDELMMAEIRINRARLEAEAGDPERAIALCRRALDQLAGGREPLWSASAFNCLATNLAARGRLAEAQEAIEQAIERVESMRERPAPSGLRGALLADRHEYYGTLIDVLLARSGTAGAGDLGAQAFEVSERSRSRTLLDEIERAGRRISGRTNPELVARAEDLGAEIARIEEALLRERAPRGRARAGELGGRLEELRADYDLVRGQIAAAVSGPSASALASPVDLATVQDELLAGGDVQILSFFLGPRESTAWIVSADTVVVRRLPDRDVIEEAARQTARWLAESDQAHLRLRARLSAETLSRLVIEPLAGELTARHLVVIADGALNGVPFAALPMRAVRDAPLLGERFVITNLPSASVGVALHRRLRPRFARGEVAVVADPVFTEDDPRVPSHVARLAPQGAGGDGPPVTRSAGLGALARLPGARREAESIARLVPGDRRRMLLGFAADRRRVLAGAVSGYRIVHFATHGLADGKMAGLVLSQVDRRGRPIDGFLRSWEVYELGLDADLVVLSACRTGLGRYVEGEGIMGLSRAFLAAGAGQVLVSLWDVDDRATAALIERFYTELLVRGRPAGEALRAAQSWVRARAEWRAPHDWAGFVLQGEPR